MSDVKHETNEQPNTTSLLYVIWPKYIEHGDGRVLSYWISYSSSSAMIWGWFTYQFITSLHNDTFPLYIIGRASHFLKFYFSSLNSLSRFHLSLFRHSLELPHLLNTLNKLFPFWKTNSKITINHGTGNCYKNNIFLWKKYSKNIDIWPLLTNSLWNNIGTQRVSHYLFWLAKPLNWSISSRTRVVLMQRVTNRTVPQMLNVATPGTSDYSQVAHVYRNLSGTSARFILHWTQRSSKSWFAVGQKCDTGMQRRNSTRFRSWDQEIRRVGARFRASTTQSISRNCLCHIRMGSCCVFLKQINFQLTKNKISVCSFSSY